MGFGEIKVNWECLIKIFDVLVCISVVVSLNLITRFYRAWLLYIIGSALQVVVCLYKGMFGMTIMGVILGLTGVKNYLVERKKARNV